MCLAILQPANKRTPIDNLHAGWISNPDGAGYAFVHEGKVVIRKGYMKLKEFLAAYNTDVTAHADSPFLIHFRIRSMGGKDEFNTHPFPIEGGALIHNGTLTGTGAVYHSGDSDTRIFANKFGKHLSYDFVLAHRPDLDEALGAGNKIALLYDDGNYHILNEQQGKWEDGVWYSNHSYKGYFSTNVSPLNYDDWE